MAGYNGKFPISCAGCFPGSGHTSFQITTASVLAAWDPSASQLPYVAQTTSRFMIGFAPNHGLAIGDSVVIEGAGSTTIIDLNQRMMYVDASYVHLRRLRLTDFPGVGLWLRGATGVVIDSVEIDDTQQEAVALKFGSHHNIIRNSWFHDTGTRSPQYGEGIYIGGWDRDGVTLDTHSTADAFYKRGRISFLARVWRRANADALFANSFANPVLAAHQAIAM